MASGTALALHPLSPVYVPDDHQTYVELLLAALAKTSGSTKAKRKEASAAAWVPGAAPFNIALTGHYGSGKSSVLAEVQQRCGRRAINVSLSSLGADEADPGRVREAGATPPLTNLIQKEIVKQLLYRKAPSSMPASRYHRIDAFEVFPALAWSAAVALMVVVLGALLKLVRRIEDVFPWGLAGHHHWVAWVTLVGIAATGAGIAFGVLHGLHNRFAITDISAGPAAVSLSRKENSYFDEYLDEIVYFFQRSEVDVVVFEDLDRFKDPHIFETLRELNTVLNNAEQVANRPIQFVYAIRDSVFDQLDVAGGDDAETAPARWQVSASSNRTKFFDLVVPMVPFISHRTSRDLLRREFYDVTPKPSERAMDLVASYLTDMRLIKNIRNEYLVYAGQILPPKGLDGLAADQLFAMMVYKNLHMEDYERIREATSAVDKVFQAARDLVDEQAKHAQRRASIARSQLSRVEGSVLQARSLGDRLGQVMPVVFPSWNLSQATYRVGSENFSHAQTSSAEFWTALAAAGQTTVTPAAYQGARSFQVSELEALLALRVDPEAWTEEAAARHQSALDAELALLRFVTHASVAELLARDDLEFTLETEPVKLTAYAQEVLPSRLAHALVREGYIEANYILYAASFGGVAVSSSAMNFILQSVQRDKADYRYHFARPADIDEVINEERDRFLHGPAVFNVEVFDHLLDRRPPLLDRAVASLANDEAPPADFVDVYLAAGAKPASLMRQLAPHWPGIFNYLAERDDPGDQTARALLNAAIQGVSAGGRYNIGSTTRTFIESASTQLDTFTKAIDHRTASAIANFLGKHALTVPDLGGVPEPLLAELVRRGCYPVTLENLRVLVGDEALALDQIKPDEHIYRHVLDHLGRYLAHIPEEQPTIVATDGLVDVLNDVTAGDGAARHVGEVAARAAAGCLVEDIETLAADAWQPVVKAARLKPTFGNVAAYVEQHGTDETLVSFLEGVEELDDPADDNDARRDLALTLINQPNLTAQTRLRLTLSLGLSRYLDPAAIRDDAIDLIPDLVAQNDLQDNVAAWNRLDGSDWEIKERLIATSTEFHDYVAGLTLTPADLAGLAQGALPDEIKALLVNRLDDLIEEMGRTTVDAVARLAVRIKRTLTAGQIARLAAGGASPGAVIDCLTPLLPSLTSEQAAAIVRALPEPYVRLTQTGAKPVYVPTATTAFVERLQDLGFVTSFGSDRKRGGLKVYTRRR